jgi:hypothetical protein
MRMKGATVCEPQKHKVGQTRLVDRIISLVFTYDKLLLVITLIVLLEDPVIISLIMKV